MVNSGKSVKTGPCRLMQVFKDGQGSLRCRARVQFLLDSTQGASPVLMNAEHPFMRSYIRYSHVKNNCTGANATLNGIKRIMHGLKLRKVVKEVVRIYAICAITRARP